jgi:integrase/recombinase XerC
MPRRAEHLTREHIEAFVGHLLDAWTASTANNRHRALQQFFRWLAEEGLVKPSPMVNMKPPNVPEIPVPETHLI